MSPLSPWSKNRPILFNATQSKKFVGLFNYESKNILEVFY